jgi:serine/threonine protein kinase
LQHKNIVGYKGCWVEACELNRNRFDKIVAKIERRRSKNINLHKDDFNVIKENEEDDRSLQIEKDTEAELRAITAANLQCPLIMQSDDEDLLDSDSMSSEEVNALRDSDHASQSDYGEDSESEEDSDVDSESSLYRLTASRKPFACLNIMILMECAQGATLRHLLDENPKGLTRKVIFHLFKQLMQALRHIHENG